MLWYKQDVQFPHSKLGLLNSTDEQKHRFFGFESREILKRKRLKKTRWFYFMTGPNAEFLRTLALYTLWRKGLFNHWWKKWPKLGTDSQSKKTRWDSGPPPVRLLVLRMDGKKELGGLEDIPKAYIICPWLEGNSKKGLRCEKKPRATGKFVKNYCQKAFIPRYSSGIYYMGKKMRKGKNQEKKRWNICQSAKDAISWANY